MKTTTDPDNPQEVATLDEGKVKILHDIFYEMNSESHSVKTETVTEYVETIGSGGTVQSTPTEKEKRILHITVSHKSADEMASKFKFDDNQKEQLKEMLEADNSLWMAGTVPTSSPDRRTKAPIAPESSGRWRTEPFILSKEIPITAAASGSIQSVIMRLWGTV